MDYAKARRSLLVLCPPWNHFAAAHTMEFLLTTYLLSTVVLCYVHKNPPTVEMLCCPKGGNMYSEKDLTHATQTMGDHDPGSLMSQWDKVRFMRHAIVIR